MRCRRCRVVLFKGEDQFCTACVDRVARAVESAHLGLCALSAAVRLGVLGKALDAFRLQYGMIDLRDFPGDDGVAVPNGDTLCTSCASHGGDHDDDCEYAAACDALGVPW